MRAGLALVPVVAALAAAPPASAQEATIALVVGAERYESERLPGAAQAAGRLAERLETLGVEVTLLTNPTRAPFERAAREFAARADGAHLAIVAYAGHALRLGDSAYLVPTDVELSSRSDLKWLLKLQELIDATARATHSLVLLDACHGSNLAKGWGERRSYAKAPLCPGDEEGFERPPGTTLAWASEVPSPRGDAVGTGRLLQAFADRLDSPSADVSDALRAAAGELPTTVVGPTDGGWPLLDATAPSPRRVEPAAEATTGNTATDTPPEARAAASLPSGRYRIFNLYRSRRVAPTGDGRVALVGGGEPSAADVWTVRANDDGSLTLEAGGGSLVAVGERAVLADRGGRWRVSAVPDGLQNERALRDADGGDWLVGDVASGEITLENTPDGTGWLFDRLGDVDAPVAAGAPDAVPAADDAAGPEPRVRLTVETVPADARVRITNIVPPYEPGIELWPGETYDVEVSHPARGRVERSVTLGEDDLVVQVVLPEAGTGDAGPAVIDAADRAAVTARLEEVRAAVESRDLAALARLVPPGEPLDRLVALMDTYAEIDVEIRDVLGSTDGRRMSAVLSIVRLVDAFGDTVTPPPVYRNTPVYAERVGASRWSGVRWDAGSG